MNSLNREPEIGLLATGLGVAGIGLPAADAIIEHCRNKIAGWIPSGSSVATVEELESLVCTKLRLVIEEIWTDDDLNEAVREYVALKEVAFASLPQQLSGDRFGALFERRHVNGRARDRYVAFIDCRSQAKAARRIFTRWHEISHALTLFQQLQLPLNRSREKGAPIERMMDLIAGEFNFYAPLFQPVLLAEIERAGRLTFGGVERIRQEFYKEASFQSTLNACVRHVRTPAAIVEASLEHNKRERESNDILQGVLIPMPPIPKKLRLSSVAPNDAGRALGLHVMLRVPESSILSKVFTINDGFSSAEEATENLNDWTHSDGTALPAKEVIVEARKLGDVALALIQASN